LPNSLGDSGNIKIIKNEIKNEISLIKNNS